MTTRLSDAHAHYYPQEVLPFGLDSKMVISLTEGQSWKVVLHASSLKMPLTSYYFPYCLLPLYWPSKVQTGTRAHTHTNHCTLLSDSLSSGKLSCSGAAMVIKQIKAVLKSIFPFSLFSPLLSSLLLSFSSCLVFFLNHCLWFFLYLFFPVTLWPLNHTGTTREGECTRNRVLSTSKRIYIWVCWVGGLQSQHDRAVRLWGHQSLA